MLFVLNSAKCGREMGKMPNSGGYPEIRELRNSSLRRDKTKKLKVLLKFSTKALFTREKRATVLPRNLDVCQKEVP